MAAIASGHMPKVYDSDDPSALVAVYALTNVTAADTADCSGTFSVIKRATYLGVTDTTAASCSVSGTTVTVPAGPSGDTGFLTVYGEAASQS